MATKIIQQRGVERVFFTAKKIQRKSEIGAAPFRCAFIGYHLKLDSFLGYFLLSFNRHMVIYLCLSGG